MSVRRKPRSSPLGNDRRDQGIALFIVLWVILAVGLHVAVFTGSLRDAVRLADVEMATSRGDALIKGALELAVARLIARGPRESWPADGNVRQVRIADTNIVIRISDENGRINLNKAAPEQLQSLFRSVGLSARDSATLTDRVMDWRDADNERRERGAETADYRRAGLEYGAANAPFIHISDLGRVLGVTPEQLLRLTPLLTLYTRSGKVNPHTASVEVLRALPGISVADVERAWPLRERGESTSFEAQLAPAREFLGAERGPAYRIELEIVGTRQALGRAEAVIVVGLGADTPYRVLSWRVEAGGRTGQDGGQDGNASRSGREKVTTERP